uniref:Iroquois homeobox 6 n=1 Tax=Aquila chrysaetos chrysaetos TaxID=223781 RepID=A0A663DYP9_AQUCH
LSSPQFFVPASPSTTCCEAVPRSVPDASSAPAAASLCCAPYESRLLAPGRAELNAALGMYGAPYAAGQGYGNYLPYSAEPAALYTALVSYEIKDGAGTLHSGIAQPAAYYSYDHSLGQYQYDRNEAPREHQSAKIKLGRRWQAGRGRRAGRWRRRAPSRRGCTSTAKTPTPPKERKSCWPSSPK